MCACLYLGGELGSGRGVVQHKRTHRARKCMHVLPAAMFECARTYTHTHTRTHTHTHTHIYIYIYIYIYACMSKTHTHARTHTHAHTDMFPAYQAQHANMLGPVAVCPLAVPISALTYFDTARVATNVLAATRVLTADIQCVRGVVCRLCLWCA